MAVGCGVAVAIGIGVQVGVGIGVMVGDRTIAGDDVLRVVHAAAVVRVMVSVTTLVIRRNLAEGRFTRLAAHSRPVEFRQLGRLDV